MDSQDWPVSTTGGEKITGTEAAKILNVSYTRVHKLVSIGRLKRAEPRNKALDRQPLILFKADVLAILSGDQQENPISAAVLTIAPAA